MPAFIDITGNRYGRLTVIKQHDTLRPGRTRWLCKCDCGTLVIKTSNVMRRGESKSCGCLQRETASKLRRTGQFGTKNPNWYGGVKKTKDGYIKVLRKGHPRSCVGGYVCEHILVMEKMLGGPLPEGAVVHHCNKDRGDNRPYNLRLFSSRSEHAKHHWVKRQEGIL
jgi:hypothetical protein